jgi:hypothetical protein
MPARTRPRLAPAETPRGAQEGHAAFPRRLADQNRPWNMPPGISEVIAAIPAGVRTPVT